MADINELKQNVATEFVQGTNARAFHDTAKSLFNADKTPGKLTEALLSIRLENNETMLEYAIRQENLSTPQIEIYKEFFFYLRMKLIPDEHTKDPLVVACKNGKLEIVKILLTQYYELLNHDDKCNEHIYSRIKEAVSATQRRDILDHFKNTNILHSHHDGHQERYQDWSKHLSEHDQSLPKIELTSSPTEPSEPFFEKTTWLGLFTGVVIVSLLYAVASNPGGETLKQELNQAARAVAKGFLGVTDNSPPQVRHAAVDSLLSFGGAVIVGITGRIGACIAPKSKLSH